MQTLRFYAVRGLGEYGATHLVIVQAQDISKAITIAKRIEQNRKEEIDWYEVTAIHIDRGLLYHTGCSD